MAMIDVGLEEFIESLIATKSRGKSYDDAQVARAKQGLLRIADRAVDIAIMNGVLRSAGAGIISKGDMEMLHELMQAGSKEAVAARLDRILPDCDELVADELAKVETAYLSRG